MPTNRLSPKQKAILIGVIATAAVLTLFVAASPASAQTTEEASTTDRLVTVVLSISQDPAAFADGLVEGIVMSVQGVSGSDSDPRTEAESLRSHLAENNDSYVEHSNLVIDEYDYAVGNGTYAYAVTVEGYDDVGFVLVASADGEDITDYRAVNSTDREIDEEFSVSPLQLEKLNEDVREYNETYVSQGEVPSRGYYLGQATKYGGVLEAL